jgi:hypothetical protein
MNKREVITSAMEVIGGVLIVVGICSFSVPIGVIVAGLLLMVFGGLAA